MLDQEPFVAEEALLQPLRIIEPIDPDDHVAAIGAVAHLPVRQPRRHARCELDEFGRIDPDRAHQSAHAAVAELHDPVRTDRSAELETDEVEKRLKPFRGVEADHVIGEHPPHQFRRFGQDRQQPTRRPGNMQEETEPIAAAALAQFVAEREQMVILNPHHVVGLEQRRDHVGEARVDPLVTAREIALIFGQIDAVVEQRPQRPVGIAVIIFVDVLVFQVDRGGRHTLIDLIVDLAGERIDPFARPAEPQAVMLAQRRRERDRQPTLGAGL